MNDSWTIHGLEQEYSGLKYDSVGLFLHRICFPNSVISTIRPTSYDNESGVSLSRRLLSDGSMRVLGL